MPIRKYKSDDFRRYDVAEWYGAIRKEVKYAPNLTAYKGEVLTYNNTGEVVKATSASKRVFFLFNPMVGVDGAGWDTKASGTVTVISGAHEADTLIYDTTATYAINQELTAGTVTVDGIQMTGVVPAGSGDMVIALVDKVPSMNRGALRIKVIDTPYQKA